MYWKLEKHTYLKYAENLIEPNNLNAKRKYGSKSPIPPCTNLQKKDLLAELLIIDHAVT